MLHLELRDGSKTGDERIGGLPQRVTTDRIKGPRQTLRAERTDRDIRVLNTK